MYGKARWSSAVARARAMPSMSPAPSGFRRRTCGPQGETQALTNDERDYLTARYHVPRPPVTFAGSLRNMAHASVDVSDGLIADLGHIASASGVRILVEGELVPLSAPLRRSGATKPCCGLSWRAMIIKSPSPGRRTWPVRSPALAKL